MVNKDDKEVVDKKRRKTSLTMEAVIKPKEDVYAATIGFEEQEALKRSPEKDSALFRETCGELRQMFSEIATLKKGDSSTAKQEIAEKRIEGSMLIVLLKKLNRLDKVRIRTERDKLHKQKLAVDSNRLQLQNLLYEASHLKKEVNRCYEFKSQDEDIELVPLEEFYENAPKDISKPDTTTNDEHNRRLARLEWELQQRKELSASCKELQVAIEKVEIDINQKSERLKSLAPNLQELLKATRPLQKALDLEIEKEWEIQKLARLLPRPLYMVYVNGKAYGEACDRHLKAVINGDGEEAAKISDEVDKNLEEDINDDPDSENEDNDNEMDTERGKGHHHAATKRSKAMIQEQKRSNLFKPHPLSITITIGSKLATNGNISLTFQYLPVLNLVSVTSKLSTDFLTSAPSVAAAEIVNPRTILDALNPDDFGHQSPNPKTDFQLQELLLEPHQLVESLTENRLGKPYKWVQNICGLDFEGTSNTPNSSSSSHNIGIVSNAVCQKHVPILIKLIRKRWLNRLRLYQQIQLLEQKNLTNSATIPPHRISCNLITWQSLPWEDYNKLEPNQRFVQAALVTEHDLYFEVIVKRDSAKLICYVAITCNYPTASPLWTLSVLWHGKQLIACNSAALREMEYWVNTIDRNSDADLPESIRAQDVVLQKQLKKAMASFDIYLESEGPLMNSMEFSPEKPFLKAFRGRQRSLPYKVIENGNVFSQIS